jgi:adenine phosphoribosyltransferase
MSTSSGAASTAATNNITATSSDTTAALAPSTTSTTAQDASGGHPAAASARAAELARIKMTLMNNLGHFADFPIPGIKFIDILPLFRDPAVHLDLLRALELQILEEFGDDLAHKPDVIVGLDARGFLFGPSIALRLNAGFVPVRKKGKMPGPCVTAAYEKEYGTDYFQMQEGAIKPGQKVLVVDDIIATGKHTLLLWPMLTVSRHCPSIENGPWLPAAPPIASKKTTRANFSSPRPVLEIQTTQPCWGGFGCPWHFSDTSS